MSARDAAGIRIAVLGVLACVRGVAVAATPDRPCSDPCFQAAQASFRDCVASAKGTFLDTVDGCLERDHVCVDACRSQRQDCRDDTGFGAELVACSAALAARKAECRNRFSLGSERRENCIDRAQVEAFRCRRTAGRRFRQALRDCSQGFDACAGACGPGEPPGGPETCRAEGKTALEAALGECRQTFQATARACFNKDVSCVQDCADARTVCASPTQATLDAALAACRTQEAAAVAACRAANPAGGVALQQCVTTAQANAFTCRDTALDASAPGFANCAGQYVLCVRACPPP